MLMRCDNLFHQNSLTEGIKKGASTSYMLHMIHKQSVVIFKHAFQIYFQHLY